VGYKNLRTGEPKPEICFSSGIFLWPSWYKKCWEPRQTANFLRATPSKLEFSSCSKPVSITTASIQFYALADRTYRRHLCVSPCTSSVYYLPFTSYLPVYLRNAYSNPLCSFIYQVFSLFIHLCSSCIFLWPSLPKIEIITRADNKFPARNTCKIEALQL